MASCPTQPPSEIIFGWLGLFAAWGFFLAPIGTMLQVRNHGSVEAFSFFPYIAGCISTLLWIVYATVTPCKLEPLVTNIGGFGLMMSYAVFFVAHAGQRQRTMLQQAGAGLVLVGAILLGGLVLAPRLSFTPPETDPPQSKQTFIIGLFTDAFAVVLFASPLSVLGQVVRTQSVEYMPLGLTLGVGACTSCWLVYGARRPACFMCTSHAEPTYVCCV